MWRQNTEIDQILCMYTPWAFLLRLLSFSSSPVLSALLMCMQLLRVMQLCGSANWMVSLLLLNFFPTSMRDASALSFDCQCGFMLSSPASLLPSSSLFLLSSFSSSPPPPLFHLLSALFCLHYCPLNMSLYLMLHFLLFFLPSSLFSSLIFLSSSHPLLSSFPSPTALNRRKE